MNQRTPVLVLVIVVLTAFAVYVNLDFFVPGYDAPASVQQMLRWQGEPSQRSMNIRQGLDLQGGLQVLLEADPESGVAFDQSDLRDASNIIKNRIDTLGVTEPLVQTQGADKVVVELPGVADPELAVRTIGETALLEFVYAGDRNLMEGDEIVTSWGHEGTLYGDLPENRQRPYIASEPASGAADDAATADEAGADEQGDDSAADEPSDDAADGDEAAAEDEAGATEDTAAGGEDEAAADEPAADDEAAADTGQPPTVYPTIVTGESIRNATVGVDQLNQYTVNFTLDNDGARRMLSFTQDHLQEVMAIALDKKIISAPVVQAAIGGEGQITGQFTQEGAEALVVQLQSGSLPVPLEVVGQTAIGPTLGQEAIDQAVKGGLIGFIVVMLFMMIYYRMPGVVAAIALVLYALYTLAIFRLMPVTLTLAGIAGFILSIGMAVDANILIFERMKEELRAGRRVRSAMDVGFARAWPSIRDSNISTLITCAILFWFGNQFGASIVKGFAVTLAVGVIASLFTAITVTRTFLHLANRMVVREQLAAGPLESPRLRALFGF